MIFTTQPMQEILPLLQKQLLLNTSVSFTVLHPDISLESYAGELITIEHTTYIYRGLKAWIDLAELLQCKMSLPKEIGQTITITYTKLHKSSFHHDIKEREKYGITSIFAQIYKMEEPAFIYYYLQALQNVNITKRSKILNLGVNRGDEFTVIKNLIDIKSYNKLSFTGIDYSQSAIKSAKEQFKENNVTFYTHDINEIENLGLGKFDLLISIGTLQSPSIPFKPFFMKLVQEYLKKDSAIILGFPNSRWIGGEMIYGAKAPNYAMSEMSLLFNDVMFCKKYLQQKKYRVTITGKHYIFLTATKIS